MKVRAVRSKLFEVVVIQLLLASISVVADNAVTVPTAHGPIIFHNVEVVEKMTSPYIRWVDVDLRGTIENRSSVYIANLSYRLTFSGRPNGKCKTEFHAFDLAPKASVPIRGIIGYRSAYTSGCAGATGISGIGIGDGVYLPKYIFSIRSEIQDPFLTSRLRDLFDRYRIGEAKGGGLTFADRFFEMSFELAPNGLKLSIKNNSGAPAKLDWNSVSYVDPQGRAYKVVHSGVRLMNKGDVQAPAMIPPSATLQDSLMPIDNVNFVGNAWREVDIFPSGAGLLSSDLRTATRAAGDPLPTGQFSGSADFKGTVDSMKGKQFILFLPIDFDGRTRNYRLLFRVEGVKDDAVANVANL